MRPGTHYVTVNGVPWCMYTPTPKQMERMILIMDIPYCGGTIVECERYVEIIKRIIEDDTVKIEVVRGICPTIWT